MSPTLSTLTAKLPTATGPFLGTTRPMGSPSFRSRRRCLRLSIPVWAGDLELIKGQVVMLLLDDSGSMFRPKTDLEGLRYIAAESVVDLLRRMGVASLGIVHWGSYCPEDLLLRPTTPSDIRRVDKELRMPESSLGGTNLAAALQFAQSVVQQDAPNLAPDYLVITDGLESLGERLEDALANLPPRCVRLLLVDRTGQCDAATERAWRDLPLGAFIRLDASDPDDWAWAAAVALFSDVGTSYPELPDLAAREYLR
jgi:hypothetical protein